MSGVHEWIHENVTEYYRTHAEGPDRILISPELWRDFQRELDDLRVYNEASPTSGFGEIKLNMICGEVTVKQHLLQVGDGDMIAKVSNVCTRMTEYVPEVPEGTPPERLSGRAFARAFQAAQDE